VDIYSAQEVGYIALQCPRFEHYHVQAENLLVEILDEQDNSCEPGQIGRVIVSSLHNFAMPLIRYDIGDYAEAGAQCACGRRLPVLKRILGRVRNMLTLPDGRRRWPSFPSSAWSHVAPITQLQMVQKSRDAILLRVLAPRALSPEQGARLFTALQACLGHPFRMEIEQVDELWRGTQIRGFRVGNRPLSRTGGD
jgi:phenylacetate-CoA ligase